MNRRHGSHRRIIYGTHSLDEGPYSRVILDTFGTLHPAGDIYSPRLYSPDGRADRLRREPAGQQQPETVGERAGHIQISQGTGPAELVGVVGVYSNGKHGKHGQEFYAYAVYKVSLGLRALHQDYRLRFGIESSYRLKNTCRIKTTMKKPVVRLLFVGIAFLLIDL